MAGKKSAPKPRAQKPAKAPAKGTKPARGKHRMPNGHMMADKDMHPRKMAGGGTVSKTAQMRRAQAQALAEERGQVRKPRTRTTTPASQPPATLPPNVHGRPRTAGRPPGSAPSGLPYTAVDAQRNLRLAQQAERQGNTRLARQLRAQATAILRSVAGLAGGGTVKPKAGMEVFKVKNPRAALKVVTGYSTKYRQNRS